MTIDAIKNKSASVVAIEPSGAVRQLLTDVLRGQGFKNVQAVATVKEAIHILEVEIVDWVITPLSADQEPNAMQLLKLITENIALKTTRVSLLISEEEKPIIPMIFEYGALSYFVKPFNKDSITEELGSLLARFEAYEWDDKRVAASYLQDYTVAEKSYECQISLNKSMLDIFPGHSQYLMNLVRPMFAMNQKEKARAILSQVMLLDPQKEKAVIELYEELFPGDSLNNKLADGTNVNMLNIKEVVVIDPDDSARKAISNALSVLGIPTVTAFETGDLAWDYLDTHEEPNLIIHEWRIPKLTGPLLIQRIRSKFPCVPMVASSSLLGDTDIPLVKEMGVATVIKKPFDKTIFLKSIIHTVQQDKLPTDTETLERKIRQNLEAGKKEDAARLRDRYYESSEVTSARKAKIEAEFAYVEGNFELSRDLAVQALKTQNDSIMLLNLLGKCFMKLQDFQAALKCFEKAQTMSPMNIQRLCAIAEANSELGNDQAAQDALGQAQKIDGQSSAILETSTKLALSQGDVDKANKLMAQLDSIMNVISYSNNKAIALARGGAINDGITLYKKTIESIPDAQTKLIPIVEYNLSLAYARGHNLEEAQKTLKGVIDKGESKVLKKSHSLLKRVELCIKKGTKLEFIASDSSMKLEVNDQQQITATQADDGGAPNPAQQDAKAPKKENAAAIAPVQLSPGDICCFLIFVYPGRHDPKHLKLIAKTPHFTKRETIEREESGGAEREMKAN